MTQTATTPTAQQSNTTSPEALKAIETVVTERQRLVDEWRQRGDNSLPPRETVFTAYNITKEVQQKHQVWAEHRVVRDDVHAAISRIMGQDECLIDIPGVTNQPGKERPRLYHPPEISHQVAEQIFSNYGAIGTNIQFVPVKQLASGDSQSQLALPGPTASASIANVAPTVVPTATPGTGGKQPDGTYLADKRGRLWIPADSLRKISAAPGDKVYVTQQPSMLVITKSLPATATQAAVYKVDSSNNIAISKSAFDESGLTGGKYSVADSGTEVRIQAA